MIQHTKTRPDMGRVFALERAEAPNPDTHTGRVGLDAYMGLVTSVSQLDCSSARLYNRVVAGKLTLLIAGLVTIMAGCCHAPYMTDERLDRGLVLVLTGVEGRGTLNLAIRDGLVDGGVDCAVEIVDWTAGGILTFPYNLRAENRNRAKAAEIAARIQRYRTSHPGAPVTLVGHSAGAAMAAFIAESLGEGSRVDGIVMLAAALSPGYRLDGALAHSRRGIVNYHSKCDWFFLAVGTLLLGTSDGRHGQAAGRVGFRPTGDAGGCEKLYQVPWNARMLRKWNLGGHLTSSAVAYVAAFVAPVVIRTTWDAEFIGELTSPNGG